MCHLFFLEQKTGNADDRIGGGRNHLFSELKRTSGDFPSSTWIGICLPVQGPWVRSLVQEDSMHHGAAEPVGHTYWSPHALETVLHNKRSPCSEKCLPHNKDLTQPQVNRWTKGQFGSVQLLSRVRLFETPWAAARQASLSITNSQSLLKLMSIKSVMPSNHLILSSPSPPAFPSFRVFSNELILGIRWPKYWSFSFSISPSSEHSGLISTSDHKMRTFGPQLRNKDSQRAIRPRVATCVLPSPAARGQGEAQREPNGSAPSKDVPSAISWHVPLFSFILSPPDGGPAMSEKDAHAVLTPHIHSFLPRVRKEK